MTAPTVLAVQSPDGLAWWCDWCHRWHRHGAGGGAGHRTAHCTDPDSPYPATGVILAVTGGDQ